MSTEEQKKKRKKILKIVGAVAGVLLLLGCCSFRGLTFLGSEPAPTSTHTTIPTITVATSSTPRPTLTPHATYTPQPTADNTAQYRAEMHSLLVWYAEAQEAVGELNRQASQNPNLFRDSSWITDMGLALGQTLIVGSEIRKLEPPPEYEEVHSHLIKVTVHYDAFVDLYTRGVDALDASLIIQATEELALATDWMDKAIEAMP